MELVFDIEDLLLTQYNNGIVIFLKVLYLNDQMPRGLLQDNEVEVKATESVNQTRLAMSDQHNKAE